MSNEDDTPITVPGRPATAPRAETEEPIESDGARYVREIKRHKWIGALLATILGTGGAVGGAVTATDRSQVNQVEVKNIKEETRALDSRVKKTEADIRAINRSVGTISASVGTIQTDQTAIAGGIEELKKENVNRLKNELEDAKAEIRRQERINRRDPR